MKNTVFAKGKGTQMKVNEDLCLGDGCSHTEPAPQIGSLQSNEGVHLSQRVTVG